MIFFNCVVSWHHYLATILTHHIPQTILQNHIALNGYENLGFLSSWMFMSSNQISSFGLVSNKFGSSYVGNTIMNMNPWFILPENITHTGLSHCRFRFGWPISTNFIVDWCILTSDSQSFQSVDHLCMFFHWLHACIWFLQMMLVGCFACVWMNERREMNFPDSIWSIYLITFVLLFLLRDLLATWLIQIH